ncbi:hypothetical protein [Glutamicibacter sp.]|uniref:hypothetical protein n=1 Tax=Glutamicibacter sp. TaxID=1931995 RepID=UPI003D6AC8A8
MRLDSYARRLSASGFAQANSGWAPLPGQAAPGHHGAWFFVEALGIIHPALAGWLVPASQREPVVRAVGVLRNSM